MNFLVRDTKNPKREPFYIGDEGFKGLVKSFGNRYIKVSEIRTDGLQVTKIEAPKIEVTPQGVKKSKK